MRHNKKRGMKLGTDASHTKAMKKSLMRALFENDRIKTLDSRAKAIRPEVDRIVTWAKRGDLASRRLAIAKLGDAELVREVFDKASQGMWADRNGGYTRIMKLGPRKGDAAEVVIIELVTEPVQQKAAPKKATKVSKVAPAKAAKADEAELEEKAEKTVEASEAEVVEPETTEAEAAEPAAEETPAEAEAETAEKSE